MITYRMADHVLVNGTKSCSFSGHEAALLGLLLKYPGRTIPYYIVIETFWPIDADEPEDPTGTIHVTFTRMREKLRPFGLGIDVVKGLGPRLIGQEVNVDLPSPFEEGRR